MSCYMMFLVRIIVERINSHQNSVLELAEQTRFDKCLSVVQDEINAVHNVQSAFVLHHEFFVGL